MVEKKASRSKNERTVNIASARAEAKEALLHAQQSGDVEGTLRSTQKVRYIRALAHSREPFIFDNALARVLRGAVEVRVVRSSLTHSHVFNRFAPPLPPPPRARSSPRSKQSLKTGRSASSRVVALELRRRRSTSASKA